MATTEVVTFKVDQELAAAMSHIENRSAFIRQAILAALGNSCPLCGGNGILSIRQLEHWREFAKHHRVEECEVCHETHLVCDAESHGHGPAWVTFRKMGCS